MKNPVQTEVARANDRAGDPNNYLLVLSSAGRYRESSIPAATWHIVGFVHVFFMICSFLYGEIPINMGWNVPVFYKPLSLFWDKRASAKQTQAERHHFGFFIQ